MSLSSNPFKLALFSAILLIGSVSVADVETGLAELKKKNPEAAFSEFRKAHKAGDAAGTLHLGLAYVYGWGVPADIAHGTDLVREAAENGLALAEYQMAMAYRYGKGVERNYETSFAWLQRAAKQKNSDAQMMMAKSYRDGVGVDVNIAKAEAYYNLAAKSEPKALMEIGVMYYDGKIVPQDFAKAAAMFRAGAERDHPHSAYWLSHVYMTGEGVPSDNEKHLEYLERAATLGSSRAQYEIGKKFIWPFGDDPVKAAYWLEKAALAGHKDALESLAFVLEKSDWKLATDKGHVFWIEAAAKSGHAHQQWIYAQMLSRGEEVAQDSDEASRYLLAAAEGGARSAQFVLGQAYYEGTFGLSIDQDKGYELIRGAALQSLPEAMKAMAGIHASGAGAEEDPFVAYMWLRYAERGGATELDGLRDHLVSRLDGGLMSTARSRLEDCSNVEYCTRPYRR